MATDMRFQPLWMPMVLATVFIVLSPAASALGTAPGDIVAYVVGVRGEADVFRFVRSESGRSVGREWIPATNGTPLHPEDRVRTRKGRLRIEFADGKEGDPGVRPTVVLLGDYTEVALSEFAIDFENPGRQTTLLDLIGGTIRNFIKGWGDRSGFSVRVSGALCGSRGGQ